MAPQTSNKGDQNSAITNIIFVSHHHEQTNITAVNQR